MCNYPAKLKLFSDISKLSDFFLLTLSPKRIINHELQKNLAGIAGCGNGIMQ